MTATVTVKQGTWRNVTIRNETFELVKDFKDGAKGGFITVKAPQYAMSENGEIRVKVKRNGFTVSGELPVPVRNNAKTRNEVSVEIVPAAPPETDQEIIDRISERFEILDEMTAATMEGAIRALIVVGPPGVGKSYGVTKKLEDANLMTQISGQRDMYEVVKGAMTAIGLYKKLYEGAAKGSVLVFDDCDTVLMDELSLNILKAALDSTKKRMICWNSDSRLLRMEGIPNKFEFEGAVIFITNINFADVRSKKLLAHLAALESRCHYLDLKMRTKRDMLLRIKQLADKGDLFTEYNFNAAQEKSLVDFMFENADRLREISLRMAGKLAGLMRGSLDLARMNGSNPERWRRTAEVTCMKDSH